MARVDSNGKSPVAIVAFANSKVLDEDGKEIKVVDIWQEKTTIFIFLRHFGCVTCRAHAVQVWEQRATYEKSGGKIVFIGNGKPHFIKSFKEDLQIHGATIYTDPSLESFRAVGFKRGFLVAAGPAALMNGLKYFSDGHRQGMYKKGIGDLWQLGGVVVIKPDGRIAYHYISEMLGDFPPERDIGENT